jgi:hypothetical protein
MFETNEEYWTVMMWQKLFHFISDGSFNYLGRCDSSNYTLDVGHTHDINKYWKDQSNLIIMTNKKLSGFLTCFLYISIFLSRILQLLLAGHVKVLRGPALGPDVAKAWARSLEYIFVSVIWVIGKQSCLFKYSQTRL